MKKFSTRKITLLAMLLAAAIVLGYVESFIPMFIPGLRLGLAQVIVMITLYLLCWYDALIVDLGRILVVSLIRGNFLQMGFFMSLTGGLLSFLVMLLAKTFLKKLTAVGVSMLGSYFHFIGQLCICAFYIESKTLFPYFPLFSLVAVGTGLVSGVIVEFLYQNKTIQLALKRYFKKV